MSPTSEAYLNEVPIPSLVDILGIPIAICSATGEVQCMNPACEELLENLATYSSKAPQPVNIKNLHEDVEQIWSGGTTTIEIGPYTLKLTVKQVKGANLLWVEDISEYVNQVKNKEQTSKQIYDATIDLCSITEELAEDLPWMENLSLQTIEATAQAREASEDLETKLIKLLEVSSSVSHYVEEFVETNRKAVSQTKKDAENGSGKLENLAESGRQVGRWAKNIATIAAQTHILALNVSIESQRTNARQGSFAVIAQEVRRLARETEKMTFEINQASDEVVEGLPLVTEALNKLVIQLSSQEEQNYSLQQKMSPLVQLVQQIAEQLDNSKQIQTAEDGMHSVANALARVDSVNQAAQGMTKEVIKSLEPLSKVVQQIKELSAQKTN